MQITPDIASHATLQDEVTAYLTRRGCRVLSMAYHDVLCAEDKLSLSKYSDPTGLYVRTAADHVALLPSRQTCLIELKTNEGRYRNAAIEAFPLLLHMIHAKSAGIRCMYVYRDTINHFEGGWMASQLPPIDRIVIPNRFVGLMPQIESMASNFYQRLPIEIVRDTAGSNDPFVVIKQRDLEFMRDWHSIVNDLTPSLAMPAAI